MRKQNRRDLVLVSFLIGITVAFLIWGTVECVRLDNEMRFLSMQSENQRTALVQAMRQLDEQLTIADYKLGNINDKLQKIDSRLENLCKAQTNMIATMEDIHETLVELNEQ